ncbi:MAG: hypothetical protein ACODAU_05510 [Myxococcota bacterium]
MDWKKLALCLVMGSTLALAGCGDDGNGNGNGGDDDAGTNGDGGGDLDAERVEIPESPTPSGCEEDGDTYFYVLNVLEFGTTDQTDDGPRTPGFNLDGYNTPNGGLSGCGQTDHTYDIDQNGTIEEHEEGVDNQLASLATTLESVLDLQAEVNSGSIVILAELEGVSDTQNDSCVTMNMLLGVVPEGVELDEGMLIEPGTTFEIDPISYDEDTGEPLISQDAVIEDGRVMAGPFTITLSIEELELAVRNASVSFEVGETELSGGLIGGSLNIDDLVTAVGDLAGDLGITPEQVRELLEPLADMSPDEAGECQAISVGLTFGAVEAVNGGDAAQ